MVIFCPTCNFFVLWDRLLIFCRWIDYLRRSVAYHWWWPLTLRSNHWYYMVISCCPGCFFLSYEVGFDIFMWMDHTFRRSVLHHWWWRSALNFDLAVKYLIFIWYFFYLRSVTFFSHEIVFDIWHGDRSPKNIVSPTVNNVLWPWSWIINFCMVISCPGKVI